MIVARTIFYAKWGKVDQLKAIMKGMFEGQRPPQMKGARLYTDLDGRFFRMITEIEFEDLASWESWRNAAFGGGGEGAVDQSDPMADLVEWGEQEFYTLEMQL